MDRVLIRHDDVSQEGVVKIADFGLSRSLAIMQHRRPHGESVGASKRVRCCL